MLCVYCKSEFLEVEEINNFLPKGISRFRKLINDPSSIKMLNKLKDYHESGKCVRKSSWLLTKLVTITSGLFTAIKKTKENSFHRKMITGSRPVLPIWEVAELADAGVKKNNPFLYGVVAQLARRDSFKNYYP
jgi:hypothetical protein